MIEEQGRNRPAADRSQQAKLWRLARGQGIGRRSFLQLLSAGGTAAVLAACTGVQIPAATPQAEGEAATEAPLLFKDAAPFIDHGGGNLEARLQDMQGLITPSRLFFVRNNSASLDLDAAELAARGRGRRRCHPP